ncbi:MAG: flagellin [Candidatus Melainabacteria bacterium]
MPMVVNTNVISMTAQRHLGINTNMLNKSLEKLASGYRINRAGDDAAGLMISETLRTQIRGSKKALDNVQDGLNMLNIADGAFQTIQDSLQRIRELTVQSANDTYATAQRTAINGEIEQLRADITRIANSVMFNGVPLIASTGAPTNFFLQVGANSSAVNDRIDIIGALGDTTAVTGLALTSAADVIINHSSAQNYISVIDTSLSTLGSKRATLGAMINRLEAAGANLGIAIENFSSSESRLRNVDVAAETAEMTRNQILQQASATVLTQANQVPQLALQLIRGQ